MDAFRVRHDATGTSYFTLANTAQEAVEQVTLAVEDAEGRAAWSANPERPAFEISGGRVYDGSGKPVKTLEA